MIRRIWDITFTVSDLNRAVEFYGKVLGLQEKYRFHDYAGFDCGGVEIGLKTWGELEPPRAGEPGLNFLIDDLDAFRGTLEAKGVRIVKPPENAQWGARFMLFADPDGNILQASQVDWGAYFKACAPG